MIEDLWAELIKLWRVNHVVRNISVSEYIHINLHLYPLSGLLSLTGKKNLKAPILKIALIVFLHV